ncbi:MAG: M56 family metallopeptidase [Hyphomonadaceae bacterium]
MSASLIFACGARSLLVALFALLVAVLMRSRPASERAAFIRVAILATLAAPLLALLPSLPVLPAAAIAAPALSAGAAAIASPGVLIAMYLAVSATLVLRLTLGVGRLAHWTRRASELTSSPWRLPRGASAAGARAVRLLVSPDVRAPLSWGWPRAVILVDADTAQRVQDARAVLEHELAHVRRRDWLFLVVGRVAVAACWFNPFLWLLVHMNEAAAEEAADQEACRAVDARDYAQSLINCARRQSWAPANAMGASLLSARVRAVLKGGASGKSAATQARTAPGIIFGCVTLLMSLNVAPAPAHEGPRVAAEHLSAADNATISGELQQARAERQAAAQALQRSSTAILAGDTRGARVAREQAMAAEGRALAAEGRAMAIQGRADRRARANSID